MGKRTVKPVNWLLTYSDFITLLLIFFIVLYTLTPGIEMTKLNMILSTFKGGEGVLTESSVLPPESLVARMRRAERWEDLSRFVEDRRLADQVQIDLMPEGSRIILREALTFPSGSSQLLQSSAAVLNEISYLFDSDVREIEVQGHTDNIPVRSGAFRSNWELGAERAASVVRYLIENTDIPPDRFKASSHGEHRPLASNDTEEGRRANRRVEIYIRYSDNNDQQRSNNPFFNPGQAPRMFN